MNEGQDFNNKHSVNAGLLESESAADHATSRNDFLSAASSAQENFDSSAPAGDESTWCIKTTDPEVVVMSMGSDVEHTGSSGLFTSEDASGGSKKHLDLPSQSSQASETSLSLAIPVPETLSTEPAPGTISVEPVMMSQRDDITESPPSPMDGVDTADALAIPPILLQYDAEPQLITSLLTPFSLDNFTKGCKWSPDGTCLLVCCEDGRLRLVNLPEQLYGAAAWPGRLPEPPVALQSVEGELIYDYAWFPLMRSDSPATCCYVSSSRAHPIHLFDAFDGGLRCSYRAYNNVDEVAAAYSVAFDPAGELLYAGFDGCLSVFDVSRPGRQIETRKMKDKRSLTSQPGIVSCIGFCAAAPDIYAAGTYLRSIGLYSSADGSPLCLLQGQTGGVTHLQFSPDGTKLYSGGRKDPEILCWDLRNLGQILYSMQRNVTTNQRMYFDSDVNGKFMFSGDCEGFVQVWDTLATPSDVGETLVLPSVRKFGAHLDCCNGVSAHPWLPVLATSSGQRHLSSPLSSGDESEDEDEDDRSAVRRENAVKLWWLGS